MASELRVDTLKDSSGNNSVGMAYVSGGSAKAWANLNGNTFGLRDSFSVSSATDQGTGDYTINFTNSMGNNDYSVSVNAGDSSKSYPRICACGTSQDTGFATSSHGITSLRPDTLAIDDMEFVNSSVLGDLA
tara:strand:+ start:639 stop:1034 length:396 start_codon:yes stop_codon:yes gene_type:complete